MSLYAQSTSDSPLDSRQARTLSWILGGLLLLILLWAGYRFAGIQAQLGQQLITAPVQQNGRTTTWGQVFHSPSPQVVAVKCWFDSRCGTWISAQSTSMFPWALTGGAAALVLVGWMFAMRARTEDRNVKDPGQGAWGSRADPGMEELLDKVTNGSLARTPAEVERNPRALYVGHVVPWEEKTRTHNYRDVSKGLLFEDARFENVLVLGSPGSGKTRGIFRPNIMLDAYYGRTAIVVDFKYPQTSSSFFDMVGVFEALGRPVFTFTPFSPESMRIPLLDGITDMTHGLSFARTIIPPPEHAVEAGEYHKDNERNAFAAMALAVANSPVPSMRELQRLGNMAVPEFESWYMRQADPDIRQAIKGIFDLRPNEIRGMLNGIRNKLSIFSDMNVARATTSYEGENIDLKEVFRRGGLLYIGIEQKYMQDGSGAVLLQLIKRRIDQALMEVADESEGAMLAIPATYYLDELASLPRLPYLMSNLSTLRSRRAGLMIGVQNVEQGSLVYTRDYWKALSTNNLGTKLEFVWGSEGQSKEDLSKKLGEMTVEEESTSESGPSFLRTPWAPENRSGSSTKLTRRRLLTEEEIQRFPKTHAVLFTKGLNPILVVTPGVEQKTVRVRTPNGRYVNVKNELHPLWARLAKHDLIALAKARLDGNAVVRKPGEDAHHAQSGTDMFQSWILRLATKGARARMQKVQKKEGSESTIQVMIRIDSLPPELGDQTIIDYLIENEWIRNSGNEEELIVTPKGVDALGRALMPQLKTLCLSGPAIHWARTHAAEVENLNPDIAVTPDGVTGKTNAVYNPESIALPISVFRDLYGVIPEGLQRVRHNTTDMIVVPLRDPVSLEKAIALGLKAQEEAALQAGPPGQAPESDAGKADYTAPSKRGAKAGSGILKPRRGPEKAPTETGNSPEPSAQTSSEKPSNTLKKPPAPSAEPDRQAAAPTPDNEPVVPPTQDPETDRLLDTLGLDFGDDE